MASQEKSSLTGARRPRFYYGYVVVAACFVIQLVAWGMIPSYGVFFTSLLNEFGWPRATISGAHSLSFIFYGFASILVGSLNDRFGPRIVVAACGLVFGLGYLLMSQISDVWQLYLFYGVIVGIGLSGMDVALLSTVARWFTKKVGTASGIVKVGAGVGMLVIPLAASGLISGFDWRTSYIILGTITLVIIVTSAQFLRRGLGQRQLLEEGENSTTSQLLTAEYGLSLQKARSTRQFWMVCAMYSTVLFCAQSIIIHVAPHAVDLGISLTNAAGIISVIGGASVVGRAVMGNAGDRMGSRRAMALCFLILVTALCWLQFAKELWALYLFAVAYGFSHGGFFALISPIAAGLFGTHSHGVILGIVTFSGTIGGAAGPLLTGYIFDITESYRWAFLILIAMATLGLILTASLRPINEKGGE